MQLARNLTVVFVAAVIAALVAVSYTSGPTQAQSAAGVDVDPALEQKLASVEGNTPIRAILTYDGRPTEEQVRSVKDTGVLVHEFDELPMLGVQGTKGQIRELSGLDGISSIHADQKLQYQMDESRQLIGADRVESNLRYTGKDVGVAVIDSGIDGTHPDLKYPEKTVQNTKIVGDNFFTGQTVAVEDVPNTATSSGHGTHVSGTAGGTGAASDGRYTGVAPGSDLVGIGTGDALFILYALEAYDYALENQKEYNIQVINNSYGTTGEFDPEDPLNVATKEAHDAGMTVVFAAGNAGPEKDTLNPYSVAPWVIGVAAGEKDGKTLADFSSRGRPGSHRYHPTLTAPGVGIASTRASTGVTEAPIAAPDDAQNIPPELLPFYTTLSGTSMASPHVAGTVALMEEANPGLTPDEAKSILSQTSNPMDYARYEAGAGYLDAFEATQVAEAN